MNFFNYLYSSEPKLQVPPPQAPPQVPPQSTKPIKSKSKTVYVVLNKSSQVLGVFDTLELAKRNGQSSTYHNCMIYEYKINDKCTFLKNPVFED
jgi:hypothetical protein